MTTKLIPAVRDTTGRQEVISVFGIEYLHIHLPDGDDLYLTEFGRPFMENLLPDSLWTDKAWRESNSTRLSGTSCVYRIRTKSRCGHQKSVVLKWNRMGEDIPGSEHETYLQSAEFNSPFEEFALVFEMRNAVARAPRRLRTHKPLAIYVPAERVKLWRTGRKVHRMQFLVGCHHEIELDMLRSYAVVYEWLKGVDAAEACRAGLLTEPELTELTLRKEADMQARGFLVHDRKPQHAIVRPRRDGVLQRDRDGRIAYGAIDFELLQRTPARQAAVRSAKRYAYLLEQACRFDPDLSTPVPSHLKAVSIMGVNYIYGAAQSTGGALWVVGRDPRLFDYFLPERWRETPRAKLSPTGPVYHTTTKDNVQLVWRLSRVGLAPDLDPFRPHEKRMLDHGFNSPFEEVALSLKLSPKCVPTTYPRAIYMAGHQRQRVEDDSRFDSHRAMRSPEGQPILRKDHDYITIWGYWNKPDEMLAQEDRDHYRAIDALQAHREGIINEATYVALMDSIREGLLRCGVEDLNLRGSHILLSIDSGGTLVLGANGLPEGRICNFELLRTQEDI